MQEIRIETVGRRHYLAGDTYAARSAIKDAGGHWDSDRRAWWFGKREAAEVVLADLGNAVARPATDRGAERTDGKSTVVAGKATYKGKIYYVAGRVIRGRTHWDDRVAAIESRDGARVMLVMRDGKSFWADAAAVDLTKRYEKPQTLEGLRHFAEGMRNGTVPVCSYCGSPSCDGARGGHCEED